MKTNGQDVVHCKNCGENKVLPQNGMEILIGIILIGLGIVIPILGWFVLLPAGIILVLLPLIFKLFKRPIKFQCQSCKHTFKVDYDVYKKYKESIKN